MAEKWKASLKAKGPTSVGMFGSGQWTVMEGYAAVKLMKAGFRSNNIDPNARHCMASAVVGFMRTSVLMSLWAVMTTLNTPMRLCFGVPTWRKCTQCSGHALLTVA